MGFFKLPFDRAGARRRQDPAHTGAQRYDVFAAAQTIPDGIGIEANARRPNVRRSVYRDVRQSLRGEDGSDVPFHLKNSGIKILADEVRVSGDQYIVNYRDDVQGIVNGGHTYRLICEENARGGIPDGTFVDVTIEVGLPHDWVSDIAGGLNTSVQVQAFALDELAHRFEWLKKELPPTFESLIAWRENEVHDNGRAKPFDARDIIALLAMFNIGIFPNAVPGVVTDARHPIAAYERKWSILKEYEQDVDGDATYHKLAPLVTDILRLYDTMRFTGRDHYNAGSGGSRRGGSLAFVESKSDQRGIPFTAPFLGGTYDTRLFTPAVYPMLAAFRWYVEPSPMGDAYQWRGGFDQVLNAWSEIAGDLMRRTAETLASLGYSMNALGKNRPHWDSLYTATQLHFFRTLSAPTSAVTSTATSTPPSTPTL